MAAKLSRYTPKSSKAPPPVPDARYVLYRQSHYPRLADRIWGVPIILLLLTAHESSMKVACNGSRWLRSGILSFLQPVSANRRGPGGRSPSTLLLHPRYSWRDTHGGVAWGGGNRDAKSNLSTPQGSPFKPTS